MERASQATATSANGSQAGGSAKGDDVKSKEGKGEDLLEDDYEGRLTMQVTSSMHEVSDK